MIPCNDAFKNLYWVIQPVRVDEMSIRENIQFYPGVDVDQYLDVLITDFGADAHPTQPDAFLVDGLPFHKPQTGKNYIFILGFNYVPLSDVLVQAVIQHPELFPGEIFIQWTQEQELLLETTLKDLRLQVG